MRLHYLQHVSFESPANILNYAEERAWAINGTRMYQKDPLPEIEDFDLLVVMGGPMGVYDTTIYPWLIEEQDLIKRTIESGKKVLGVCLGAQLIAASLGARVYPGPMKEIGWYPIMPLGGHPLAGHPFRSEEMVFHWHGDTFDLPEGAVGLFTSLPGILQGFAYKDHVLALQFHLEMRAQEVQALVAQGEDELTEGPYIQEAGEILGMKGHYQRNKNLLYALLDRFLGV